MRTFQLGVGAGVATCIRVEQWDDLPAALAAVGLPVSRPVVVVVGGAGRLDAAQLRRLTPIFTTGLVPAIERAGAVAVDGGTDAGVMRMLGEARAAHSSDFPLVGVAAEGTVRVPGARSVRHDAAELEPHHTHFVLVRDAERGAEASWGDEAPWISRAATCLAASAPSVTVLVNGGDITFRDAALSLDAGRPVLVVAGSGRVADEVTAALLGEVSDPRAQKVAESDLVSFVDVDDPSGVCEAVTAALGLRTSRRRMAP